MPTRMRNVSSAASEDLSKSLQAAGVPERQGRDYVAVLGRAIRLADGLSVADRFDLVVERPTTARSASCSTPGSTASPAPMSS